MQEFKENYLNQNERMNPQLENMLKSNLSDLAKNPAFPKTDANGNPINFLELIAYKRFLEVIEKVKRYTNLPNVTGGGLGQLNSFLMQGVQFIQQVEAPHKLQLENLAVDLVVNEMEIPDGVFQFQCKLVPVGSINQDGFQKEVEEPKAEEVNQAFENESQELEIPADELFEDEKYKRRFINMLIQGSSKKGHYMFELVRRKINEYNPNLAETYGKVMSINDLIYWLLDDNTIKQMASNPSVMGGKEEIEESEDGSIIKTEAICFPISLHEIIKGVMEVFGTQGLPDDPQQAQLVINAVDSLSNETMDLRLGAIVWEKFVNAYPNMIFEEGNRYLQHYLFSRFCALPTDEFFRVSRLIMSDDPKGAKYLAKMVDEIQNDLQREDYEKNIDDINLDDLLGYKNGGKVSKGYNVFNYTDNVYATDEVFKTKKLANEFIKEFRNRFSRQGYYRDNQMNKIAIEDIDLLAIPSDFSPFRKFNGGGGVNSNYGKFGDDNSNIDDINIDDIFNYKKGGQTKNKKGDIGKSGTQYGYTLKEWDKIAEKNGLLVSPTQWWKSREGKKYKDSFGRNKTVGQHSGDKEQEMNRYGYMIANGMDLGSDKIPASAKKYVQENNLNKFGEGGGTYVDLFEDYENIPANVQAILDEYDLEEDSDYDTLLELQNRLETIGYTFEYGLDAVPYGLRPSSVKLNELEGYENEEYAEGGEAGFDIYDFDKKMALINLGQVYEYAIKLDKMIKEDTDLEEWVKMKLTRIEQNIADVKHSLEGWEKYEDGGEIPKKQLLHIAKYSKDLIEMISNGSKLMSWQKNKLAISSASIDDIYHHLDYEMGNRAEDLDVNNEYAGGGFVSKGELVWKKLSSSDKINFLNENFTPQITARTQQTLTGKAYNFLPKNVKIVLESKYANVEEYAYGGEIQEWMEKALQSLIEETGNNNLQIFYVKENEFTCQDDDSNEYRVFKNEGIAKEVAVEEVESDMEYQPENFNRDFIMEYVEIDDLFVNSFENINYDYTKDIQSEKSEKYENRLIEELVANGLISEEEAQTRSSKELDEEYTQDYIDLLTSEQIGDDNGITHFIDNFGENDFFALVYENNLIDVEYASKKAVEIDGIAHFLAGYDGETIYLDNNNVAYRTN